MFTHSALLWFLPLALLPILLHLLSRWRVKTIELSTFRFLMEGAQHQRRRARLLEWLVLLLRTAFIVLIVFAVSRPVSSTLGNLFSADGSPRNITLVIDTSASMGLRAGGQSSFERAKAAAGALINRSRPEDFVRLIDAGSTSHPRVVFEGHPLEPARIKAIIEAMATGPSRCDIKAAIESTSMPEGELSNTSTEGSIESKDRVIVIITDGQRDMWASLKDKPTLQAFSDDNVRRATSIILNVGANEPTTNTAIIGEPPRGVRPIVGLPVQLTATITSSATHGPRQSRGYVNTTLSVYLDDRLVDQMSISLAPGTTTTRTITVTPTRAGLIKGKLSLPADALTADDEFLFCLNVQAKLNVLAVIAPPQKDAKPADQPFIYLDAALTKAPRELTGGAGINSQSPNLTRAIELASIHHDILTEAQLATADVVILADAPVDPTRAAMLRRYVDRGGGLLVMPGPRSKREVINEHLLPDIDYDEPMGDPADEATFKRIGTVRLTHPIMTAFSGDAASGERADYFEGVRLMRFYPIRSRGAFAASPRDETHDETKKREDARPRREDPKTRSEDAAADIKPRYQQPVSLLSLTDGTPVLVESRVGRGFILLAGFPATPDWSNLPVTGRVFVPLLLRITEHLRRASPVRITEITAPGQAAQLRIADPWRDAQAQLTDATGKPHTIALHRDDRERAGLLPPAERKGFYTIDIDPRTPTTPRTQVGFAVNTDARESDVTMIDETLLREVLGADLRYLRGSADDPQLLSQLNDRREVWRDLIWILFAVIGVEFVLATLRGRAWDDTKYSSRSAR